MDVRHSVADPTFDARVNIIGFINLLEACKNTGVKKVVFASSGGAVYGEQDVFPAAEDHPTRPASPYGVSKRAGELYLSYYQQAFRPAVHCAAIRQRLWAAAIRQGRGRRRCDFLILAVDRQRTPVINGDGGQTRDYVYVGDVVAANVAALDSTFVGPVNIGTGVETDVVTIFRHLRQSVGSQIEAQHGPAKPGEQRRSCVDAARAAQVLNWRPQMLLEEGLRRTAEFYRETAGR